MFHSAIKLAGKVLAANKLSILIYHQVLETADPMRPSEPTAEVFDWQMRLLRDYFTPLSLDEALAHLRHNTLPANAVCVTFDDGYINNLTIAQPILAKYGIAATVYIATGFSQGQNMWNDRLIHLFADTKRSSLQLDDTVVSLADWPDRRSKAQQWLKSLKYLPFEQRLAKVNQYYAQNQATEQAPLMMNPAQLKQLAASGITLGAHTVHHPILKVLPAGQQQAEIHQSKHQLEQWLGQRVMHFAYPNGGQGTDFDDTAVQLVKQAGFASAVVTNWGVSDRHTPAYLLKRFTPWDKTPLAFHLRLVKNMLSQA
ncbi:polysaccharide deacetylase family protein [Rheinheimera nanhaiensis]|uniref:Polysaccharide deacetylase n=1 Tax=Rheinheimera nanhaiensis E407-8 TaxID=562729 RepID=I1E335_9GAMM|nr:polysaccharide deacetylase family protein [Rheinheimera nanhaiensis]GAB60713.1 polysaccharide deacetylase [Rheinheimera nanhaiensis E407-8]